MKPLWNNMKVKLASFPLRAIGFATENTLFHALTILAFQSGETRSGACAEDVKFQAGSYMWSWSFRYPDPRPFSLRKRPQENASHPQ